MIYIHTKLFKRWAIQTLNRLAKKKSSRYITSILKLKSIIDLLSNVHK